VKESTNDHILVPARQRTIETIIRQEGSVRVDALCDRLNVSPATVRRDLEALEERGLIRRVHGGAVSLRGRLSEPFFDEKTSMSAPEKREIAAHAFALIESGDTLYLDGGSTVLELARLLKGRDDVTVVTNSLRAAAELAGDGPRLILIGGELRRRSQTIVGSLTRGTLSSLHLDKAFMGTMGLSLKEGMTTTDPDEAFTKELVMERAARVILLTDSSKVGEVTFAHAGGIASIHTLITDRGADEAFIEALREKNVDVIQ